MTFTTKRCEAPYYNPATSPTTRRPNFQCVAGVDIARRSAGVDAKIFPYQAVTVYMVVV